MGLIEELRWRGLVQDITPGTEEFLSKNKAIGYVGFDPTAPSLGIGNLVPVMLLVHFQRYGHHPIALVGGATGRIGDPSGKSEERKLLSDDQLYHNQDKIKSQLSRLLDFEAEENPATIANNYDWFKDFKVLDFLRDVGKHFTVNYMMSKDSVKSRLGDEGAGMSFTEFSYQLIQGYDFYHLHQAKGCHMQFGGSDQWGNITAGTRLIKRIMGPDEEVFAFTCPLITNSEGKKFGKSERGNIFIDPEMTSSFRFYQFWIQQNDSDIVTLAKIFSLKTVEELGALIEENNNRPNTLQRALAEEMTVRIHGQEAFERVIWASGLLFAKNASEELRKLTVKEVGEIFDGVPSGEVSRDALAAGVNIVDFLAETGATKSKGDARRKLTKDRCISINTNKTENPDQQLSVEDAINDQFILVNIGKKNRHIVYLN